jgi:hypothetical protein
MLKNQALIRILKKKAISTEDDILEEIEKLKI